MGLGHPFEGGCSEVSHFKYHISVFIFHLMIDIKCLSLLYNIVYNDTPCLFDMITGVLYWNWKEHA